MHVEPAISHRVLTTLELHLGVGGAPDAFGPVAVGRAALAVRWVGRPSGPSA